MTTAHGGRISVPHALRIAAEADIMPVVMTETGGVLSYGLTRRVASIGQRRRRPHQLRQAAPSVVVRYAACLPETS